MEKKWKLEITSVSLHLIAMAIMLCDHCKLLFPDAMWLSCVGRIAFPIFAFLIVEGYHYTRHLRRYTQRLVFFALLAEIPFDLMAGSTPFYLAHQNVLWTFLIGLGLVHINEKVKKRGNLILRIPVATVTVVMGYWIGKLTNVDYMQAGVLTVLMFYFFRGRKWWNFLLQFASLAYVNFVMLGSYALEFTLLDYDISFPRQGLAMLSLIPIWLYRGKQGYRSKWLQYLNYSFYPSHMLVIAILAGSASSAVLLAFTIAAAVVLVWRHIAEETRAALRRKLDEMDGAEFAGDVITCIWVLFVVAPFLYPSFLSADRADTVTIKYVKDYASWRDDAAGNCTRMVSTDDENIIQEWVAFYKEAIPDQKRSKNGAFKKPIPAYIIEFRKGNTVVSTLWVTLLEVVLYDQLGSSSYFEYYPLNDYYFQADYMMKELEGS